MSKCKVHQDLASWMKPGDLRFSKLPKSPAVTQALITTNTRPLFPHPHCFILLQCSSLPKWAKSKEKQLLHGLPNSKSQGTFFGKSQGKHKALHPNRKRRPIQNTKSEESAANLSRTASWTGSSFGFANFPFVILLPQWLNDLILFLLVFLLKMTKTKKFIFFY